MRQDKTGYIPYLIVVFLNAFVDLGHKIVIQNTIFKSYDGQTQVILTAIVNGLILLPFVLLFSPAGFLADRYAKHRIIRYSALFAVVATLLITFAYYQGGFWTAFGLTFALAMQSAIYSPAKYGYIKELVGAHNLASANGVVQAVTIVGILLGTFVFSILFEALLSDAGTASTGETMQEIAPIGWILVVLSALEWLVTALLPARQPGRKTENFRVASYLRLRYLRRNLGILGENTTVWLSVVGLATFWAISQVMLAAFPAFAKEALDITNTVVIQGVLACSGIGIVLGSLVAGKVSRNYIETGLIPLGALGIALGMAVLPGLDSVLGMGLTFVTVGMMGGLFIVPLNALIQFQANNDRLGTVLAGNNWIQNVVMLGALALTVGFALAGIDSVGLFYMLTLVAIVGTGYTVRKLPHSLVRILVTAILKRRYRVEVIGFDHLPQAGATLLLGNHISWIDWALVQIACPRPIRFVMLKRIYDNWYLKPLFKAFGVVPIAAGQSQQSLATINALLKAGECVCLFPEGAISRNGHLGKFHTGYQRTLEGIEDGVIVPFYLHGLWGSSLSRADAGLRQARTPDFRRDLIIAFGPPLPLDIRAKQLKQKVFELSISAWQAYSGQLDPVPLAWLRTAKRASSKLCVSDGSRTRLSHAGLVARTVSLSRALSLPRDRAPVGVLLPAGVAALQTQMALQLQGRVVVPLNPTAPRAIVRSVIAKAGIRQVMTSRAYAEELAARDFPLDELLSGTQVSYVDELQRTLPGWKRLANRIQLELLPATWCYRLWGRPVAATEPAAILFTDGRQNAPEGVVLSHRNLMANCKQMSDVLNTRVDDVIMACLPPYHPMGLTLATILPMVEGIPVVCHPEPTDTLGIAKSIARYSATILPGSPGTLGLFARNEEIHPLMLESIRLVVSGAELMPAEVRRAFELKFGKRIYEGYGMAETTTAVTVNIPDAMDTSDWKIQQGNIPGTMGMPLPGTSVKIVDPLTGKECPLGQTGRVLVSGSQIMLGYLHDVERTGAVISESDGQRWYNTGGTGHLTEEGFLALSAV